MAARCLAKAGQFSVALQPYLFLILISLHPGPSNLPYCRSFDCFGLALIKPVGLRRAITLTRNSVEKGYRR
jgi:hypothetical protein